MSASTTPTLRPCAASAVARFTVMEDLPTPPLPEATAKMRVRVSGSAKGIAGPVCSPRSLSASARRCSSLMVCRVTVTSPTPSSSSNTARVLSSMVSRIGQPAMVR